MHFIQNIYKLIENKLPRPRSSDHITPLRKLLQQPSTLWRNTNPWTMHPGHFVICSGVSLWPHCSKLSHWMVSCNLLTSLSPSSLTSCQQLIKLPPLLASSILLLLDPDEYSFPSLLFFSLSSWLWVDCRGLTVTNFSPVYHPSVFSG